MNTPSHTHTLMRNKIYDNHKTNEINSGSKLKRSPEANNKYCLLCMCSLVVSLAYLYLYICYFITWAGDLLTVSSFRQFVVVVVVVVDICIVPFG